MVCAATSYCCRMLQAVSDELNPDEVKEVYETMSPALLSRIRDMAVS